MGQGTENFDGVIGVTSDVLTSLLKITGPISIEGYPGTYDSGNAIISLEYQVEEAYTDQGIEKQDRKEIMNELFKEIMNRVVNLKTAQKLDLLESLITNLNQKDIQLYFNDPILETERIWPAGPEKWMIDGIMIIWKWLTPMSARLKATTTLSDQSTIPLIWKVTGELPI